MIIRSKTSVSIKKSDGETVVVRPDITNYSTLNPKDDSIVAMQLFVLRKHRVLEFDILLPQDKEILDTIPNTKDRFVKLAEKVHLKPSPVGRLVQGISKQKTKKEAKHGGHRKDTKKPEKIEQDTNID